MVVRHRFFGFWGWFRIWRERFGGGFVWLSGDQVFGAGRTIEVVEEGRRKKEGGRWKKRIAGRLEAQRGEHGISGVVKVRVGRGQNSELRTESPGLRAQI